MEGKDKICEFLLYLCKYFHGKQAHTRFVNSEKGGVNRASSAKIMSFIFIKETFLETELSPLQLYMSR